MPSIKVSGWAPASILGLRMQFIRFLQTRPDLTRAYKTAHAFIEACAIDTTPKELITLLGPEGYFKEVLLPLSASLKEAGSMSSEDFEKIMVSLLEGYPLSEMPAVARDALEKCVTDEFEITVVEIGSTTVNTLTPEGVNQERNMTNIATDENGFTEPVTQTIPLTGNLADQLGVMEEARQALNELIGERASQEILALAMKKLLGGSENEPPTIPNHKPEENIVNSNTTTAFDFSAYVPRAEYVKVTEELSETRKRLTTAESSLSLARAALTESRAKEGASTLEVIGYTAAGAAAVYAGQFLAGLWLEHRNGAPAIPAGE